MQLQDKIAVVYGAAGSIGSVVARRFATEGATVHLTGRRQAPLEAVSDEIKAAGGTATSAVVDAHDHAAVNAHAMAMLASDGRMDVSFNATTDPSLTSQPPPMHMNGGCTVLAAAGEAGRPSGDPDRLREPRYLTVA